MAGLRCSGTFLGEGALAPFVSKVPQLIRCVSEFPLSLNDSVVQRSFLLTTIVKNLLLQKYMV